VKTNALTSLLGIGFVLNGVYAFFFSVQFFDLLPDYYGAFNNHFVKDAGIAFASSGLLLLLSLKMTAWRVPLTLGGAMFVILHGVFHLQMLTMGMATTRVELAKEWLLIITPSILTALLLVLRIRGQVRDPS
jgi:hypothetical protein